MNEYLVLFIILLLSFDSTLFFQSLISQPIFSCQLVGTLVGNYELGLGLGAICQLVFLSYAPVGGAKIPDVQVGPNLVLLLFADQSFSLDLLGKLLPISFALSIVYLYVTSAERHLATLYMKKVAYEDIVFSKMLRLSFFWHSLLFGTSLIVLFFIASKFTSFYLEALSFDGKRFFYFMLFFSLGSLSIKYFKRGFKQQ